MFNHPDFGYHPNVSVFYDFSENGQKAVMQNQEENIDMYVCQSTQGGVIMKKSVVYLLAGVLMFQLAACGNDANNSQESSGSQSSSESVSNSSDLSTGNVGSSETLPGTDGGSEGTLPGEEGGWSEEMTGLKSAVVDLLGQNYWPDMALDAEMLEVRFGVTKDMYDDFLAEIPMISNNVDTLVIVKAKEGQADAVESALNAYRDVQVQDTMQYPMNVGKVQASMVEKTGNYVIFVLLGADTTELMEQGDEAVVEACQQVNQSVIDAIKQKLGQ